MSNPASDLVIGANKGRYGSIAPLQVPDGYCEDAVNVEWWQSALGKKRPGLTALTMTNGPATAIRLLVRYLASGAAETSAELWALCVAGSPASNVYQRSSAGAWTLRGDTTGNFSAANFNGKLFIAGGSTVNYVWDGTVYRPMGFPQPAAPTGANGGGAGTNNLSRYYKVAFTVQSSGVTIRRSELSPALLFTPDGSHAGVTVTMPAKPTYTSPSLSTTIDLATHWELYASADGATYSLQATTAIATTTYADSTLPTAYAGTNPPVSGTNAPPPVVNYVVADQDLGRLLLGGSPTVGGYSSRIWFTPVLGSLNVGDDERVPPTNYVDVGPNDGETLTGISPPIAGVIYAFKRRNIYKLLKTGNADAPYQVVSVSHVVGTWSDKSMAEGEDHLGRAALYFSADRGPYRIGSNGLEYLGTRVEDVWTVPTTAFASASVCYFPGRRQVYFWHGAALDACAVYTLPTGTGSIIEAPEGAWSRYTGLLATAGYASCLYTPTAGSALSLVPYMAVGTTVYAFTPTANSDAGTLFAASIVFPAKAVHTLVYSVQVTDPTLVAKAGSPGASVQVTVTRDFGLESFSQIVPIDSSTGLETHVVRRVENANIGGAKVVQFTVGDPAATAGTWSLDALVVSVVRKEPY